MPLFINKIYNVCGAWEKITDNYLSEFEDLKAAFLEISESDYSSGSMRIFKEHISEILINSNWQSKSPLIVGMGKYTKLNSDPKRINFLARKELIAFDLNTQNPTYIDSWVSFKAKVMSSNGFIPVLALPLLEDDSLASRLSYEYAVERIRYLDIVEGNQFIVIGYSSSPAYMEIVEADSIIQRTITFEPHQVQAGVGLLSYFSEILKQKISTFDSKVTIEQDGEKVRLLIKSKAGSVDMIETLLNDYGLVLNGQLAPEKFMDNEVQLLSLRNKLDMSAIEVKHQKDILALTTSSYNLRIESLEDQLKHLKAVLSKSIISNKVAQSHVSSLIEKFTNGSVVESRLIELAEKIDNGLSNSDKKEFESTLTAINKKNPKLAQEFIKSLKGPLEGVAGNILYSWLPNISILMGSVIR